MIKEEKKPNLLSFFKIYRLEIFLVIFLSILVNGLSLILPRINSRAIDSLQTHNYNEKDFLLLYIGITTVILVIGLIRNVVGSITSEKIAAELRRQIIEKLSKQSFSYINEVSSSKLLTNLTSDVDAVKLFINQGLVIAFAAVVELVGSAILLLSINWRLALPVLLSIPVLLFSFGFIFKSIQKYFKKSQEVIDLLNRVINESIVGNALIRVLNADKFEIRKFNVVNEESKFVGLKIVNGFAGLIPIITLTVNVSFLLVLGYGGVQIIDKTLSPGDFSAFFSYIFIFISPIILLGFLASSVGRAFTTYSRIREVLDSKEISDSGTIKKVISGDITLKDVNLILGNKNVLKEINFDIKKKNRVGIIGPTASGKTQIFYLITGLIKPDSGSILVDGVNIKDYERESFYSQVGMVFQDSIIFNTTIRENIAFRKEISDDEIWKAIETAELKDFVNALPLKLDEVISERGSSLSGGQKQRLTLARALSINPKILLLDDFTARVDVNTEKKILDNLNKNYPDITIVAITQKIDSIKDFDHIILVMEGELLGVGKHDELLKNSLEYQQIFKSQQNTENN